MNLLKLFKIIAYAEGISYLLFGLTMPLKYYFMMPEPNFYVGMIHGFLFMIYSLFTLFLFIKFRWSFLKAVLVFAASLIPFGTFMADKRLFNDRKSIAAKE
jgi:integral membrane protein